MICLTLGGSVFSNFVTSRLFEYEKQLAEKARSKYPERGRKMIGVGVVRTKSGVRV